MMTADAIALPIPGRVPVAPATARRIAVVLALILLIGGVVILREAGVVLGLNGLHSQWWMVPMGAGALVIGAWLVFMALRPRRKTVVAVDAAGSVWMRPSDVARLASYAASTVPGVEVLQSRATRRKVVLYVGLAGVESDVAAKGAITAAVGSATEILLPPPQIAVRIGTSGPA
jgi:hypothetical protein